MPLQACPDVTDAAEACPEPVFGYDSTGSRRWYAVWVRSNREFRVQDFLSAAGIGTFLPTWSETVQWSDRKTTINRPLFPGYVFARMSAEERHEALHMSGVIQFLPNSLEPQSLDASELESVRLVAQSNLEFKTCDFHSGERVTIEHGPLAGVSGVVVKTKGSTRVIVSVELLRRSISVECPADALVKVAA
jgi:transcription antitermination factor NusG